MTGQPRIPLDVTEIEADLIVRIRYFLRHIRQTSAYPIVDIGQRKRPADSQLAELNAQLRVPFERWAARMTA